jgi:hypothetical protein
MCLRSRRDIAAKRDGTGQLRFHVHARLHLTLTTRRFLTGGRGEIACYHQHRNPPVTKRRVGSLFVVGRVGQM